MQQVGVIPFDHWREKDKIIKEIKHKFKNKVKIKIESNYILYEHTVRNRDGSTYLMF